MNLDVALNEGNDPSVGSGVVEVDQFLDEGLVEEEPVVYCTPRRSRTKLVRAMSSCVWNGNKLYRQDYFFCL